MNDDAMVKRIGSAVPRLTTSVEIVEAHFDCLSEDTLLRLHDKIHKEMESRAVDMKARRQARAKSKP